MSHPDKYTVGLLGMGMATLALLIGLGVAVFVCSKTYRFLPLRRSRTTYWIGMALMVPPCLATFPLAPKAMQALAVIASFGWDAYADGLRVISKHGQLSDGRFLGVFWAAAMGVGCVALDFSWVIPVAAWHCHFNPSRNLQCGVAPAGVVRLDGEPLRRALVTFHLVAGGKLRGYATVEADETGRYEFRWLPLCYRVTVAGGRAAIPPKCGDPAQTPLEFVWDQLGPVTQDLELQSCPGDDAPPQELPSQVTRG